MYRYRYQRRVGAGTGADHSEQHQYVTLEVYTRIRNNTSIGVGGRQGGKTTTLFIFSRSKFTETVPAPKFSVPVPAHQTSIFLR
jgi:hypothetical protein